MAQSSIVGDTTTMAPAFVPGDDVAGIRRRLGHPVVDADGHLVEFMPMVIDCLREVAGDAVADRFVEFRRSPFTSGGFLPTRVFFGNPLGLDRMTVMLPDLLHRRLEEIGLDFALLYPTSGLSVLTIPDDELRQAAARALNTYYSRVFAEHRDRLEPVAVIPAFSPAEAVAELEYAVGTLGLKAIVLSGVVPRTLRPDGTAAPWVDTLGHDSIHDYAPLWRRCVELGVAPAFHGIGYGWGTRVSATNYVHNHLGNFAAAQEGTCRSLIMGGALARHRGLRLSFLEGGVTWAAQLYTDLLGHHDKRNKEAVKQFDPARFDPVEAAALFDRFATGPLRNYASRVEEGARPFSDPRVAVHGSDDFAESGISGPDDIIWIFTQQLSFGCEADDPMNALAFDRSRLPHRIHLNAMFASDIGHWDVPNVRDVLPEAWELVEEGYVTEKDFADFTCGNVVRLLTDMNPRFFEDTAVADAVRPLIRTVEPEDHD
jgi:predicted TIM-barrel fold metal-dependent hydrolase